MSKMLKKYLVVQIGIIILIIATLTISCGVNKDSSVLREGNPKNANLGTIQVPPQNSRILVVAPHNDDEAIGASQFISHSIMNGCKVKIVMVTNGDDFKRAFGPNYEVFIQAEFFGLCAFRI